MGRIKPILKWFVAKRIRMVILIGLIATIGFWFVRRTTTTQKTPQVQTATVDRGTIIASVSASGSVVATNSQAVTTKATGIIKNVYVTDGQEVTTGQKIADIDLDSAGQIQNASAYASYLNAVKSLNSARNAYRSSQASLAVVYDAVQGHDADETLEMKETRTKAEVANDNAYDALKPAEASLTSASLTYQQSSPTIVAPAAGVVSNLLITPGLQIGSTSTTDNSTSSTRIATIESPGSTLVSVSVSEIDVPQMNIGQEATVTFDSIEDKTFTGTVVAVDRLGSTTSGVTSYPVLIQLDTKSDAILVNMAATASITVASKTNVLTVPSTAITTQNGQSTVTLVKDGNQITTQVEIGFSSDTATEITSGVTEGDTIVTGAASADQQTQFGGNSFGGFGGTRFIGR